MHGFKGNKNVISNETIRHGGTLVSLIMLGKKRFNLFAKTLGASLEMTLLRLMGRYCVILVGFFIFRTRII